MREKEDPVLSGHMVGHINQRLTRRWIAAQQKNHWSVVLDVILLSVQAKGQISSDIEDLFFGRRPPIGFH